MRYISMILVLFIYSFSILGENSVIEQLSWGDFKADLELAIQRDGKESLIKKMSVWLKEDSSGQKMLAVFTSPSNMRGMAFLTDCKKNLKDEWYTYVRTIRRVKKVPPESKNFMLRDFLSLYLLKPRAEQWSFKYSENGILTAEAKNSTVISTTGYKTIKHTIDLEKNSIKSSEFFDKNGELVRTQEVLEFKKFDNVWIPIKFKTYDKEEGVTAIITLDNVILDSDISDRIFTSSHLKTL
ncbi:outer membrane lipoprotein-sorting protein [bacterium]|nr:outer membrane lipoprotein-sorting protein [bacterium]